MGYKKAMSATEVKVRLNPEDSEKLIDRVEAGEFTIEGFGESLRLDGGIMEVGIDGPVDYGVDFLDIDPRTSITFTLAIEECCTDELIDFFFDLEDEASDGCDETYTGQEVRDRILEIVHEEMDDKDSSAELIGLLMNEFGSDEVDN